MNNAKCDNCKKDLYTPVYTCCGCTFCSEECLDEQCERNYKKEISNIKYINDEAGGDSDELY